jgi:hypothetical protein
MTPQDKELLKKKHISESKISEQLQSFADGFPFLKIFSAAAIGQGISKLSPIDEEKMLHYWEVFLQTNADIVKFVPASGAASRMFKDLFSFLESERNEPQKPAEKDFFENIHKFAFYDDLDGACIQNGGKNIPTLIVEKKFKKIVENLLLEKGLNYGALPKGLLRFHTYTNIKRTPAQEHLSEGALYAANKAKKIRIHFTVSTEHRKLFEEHLERTRPRAEAIYDAAFDISFSEQKPSTDTIAVDLNNKPFREGGKLVFRPGGHGALIENLNDIKADVIFIKNIDNVVPDHLKQPTVRYKKILAGVLVNVQEQCFNYMQLLENEHIAEEKLAEIVKFCENTLCIYFGEKSNLKGNELRLFLIKKLNRPIRVCGMVKNEGEPGGGPYITFNADGTASPQILESSQIDTFNPKSVKLMQTATHFNPVDLVCATKDYTGKKFNLKKYIDKSTGFISSKSKNGKELKALELPGLWNGAMSDWNTVFVEVPVETFNPVKTVNDLLRVQHQ